MTKYRVQGAIDFGLSSGEDSDEDDTTAPEGFEEEIKSKDGWVHLECTPNIPPLIHYTIFIHTLYSKNYAAKSKNYILESQLHYHTSSSSTLSTARSHI